MNHRILILANRDTGLYYFRKELIESLLKDEYDVFISVPEGEYTDYLRKMGCKVLSTSLDRRGKNPLKDLILLRSYFKILKTVNPKVVLSYTIKPNIYGGIACSSTKTPFIANITGLGTEIESGGIISKALLGLYRVGLRNAFCVFVQNSTIDKTLHENKIANGKRIIIPGSGVNLQLHQYIDYPSDETNIHLLYIGRVMKDKGIDELLYAAKEIKKRYSNVIFDIVGRCDEAGYEEIIEKNNNNGIISFHGFQSDVVPFLSTAHALIQPSYHEGLSNVLLEAAATGRPVLASLVPGCQETFDEGISGIGFKVKSGESLVTAIESFLSKTNDQKREMGLNGRRKIEKEFDRKIVIEAYRKQIICAIKDA